MNIDRPSRLVLIRHAESLRNQAKKGSVYFADDESRDRIKGISDDKISLTDWGHEQALQTGIKLRERFGVPDYLYHSGYRRTMETLDGILALPIPPRNTRR